jgi:hypothetical protein
MTRRLKPSGPDVRREIELVVEQFGDGRHQEAPFGEDIVALADDNYLDRSTTIILSG